MPHPDRNLVYSPTSKGVHYLQTHYFQSESPGIEYQSIDTTRRFGGSMDWTEEMEGGKWSLARRGTDIVYRADIFAFDHLMSKPWTKDDYVTEMEYQKISPHISSMVWAWAKKQGFITTNNDS